MADKKISQLGVTTDYENSYIPTETSGKNYKLSIQSLINYISNGFMHYIQGLDEALNEKVDKVTGKGLSTNDYTTAEKNKLADFEGAIPESEINTLFV